ncbi:MAG TPA: hypothetical protein VM695_10330, partial [Phycisphaerae bacterium]|nr:hypothetical protein [Phycisphaerae bacterium]
GFGGKNPQITFEQVADAANVIAWYVWQRPAHSKEDVCRINQYHQWRNEASYASRRKRNE